MFFELAISTFQLVVLHSFFVKNLDGKRLRSNIVHYAILGIFFAVLTFIPNCVFSLLKLEIVEANNLNASLTIVSIVLLVFILYIGNLTKKSIFITIYLFVNIAAEVLTVMISMIAGAQIDIFSINPIYYTIKSITLVFAFIILNLISIFKVRKKRIKPVYGNLLIVVPSLSILSIFFLYTLGETLNDNRFTVIYPLIVGALLYFNIFIFYLFEKMIDRFELEKKNLLLDEQIAYQKSRYEKISDNLMREKTKTHDLRHHMLYIREHSEGNKDVYDYVEKILGQAPSSSFAVSSGNSVIDVFVGNVMAESEKYFIRTKYKIAYIGEDLLTEKDDLCAIIGNIFDNAIEACKSIPDTLKIDRFIDIDILKDETSLVISVTNSYSSENVKKINGRFKTSKKDKENHGIGLYSIEQILEKNKGYSIIDSNMNTFSITCVLPYSFSLCERDNKILKG